MKIIVKLFGKNFFVENSPYSKKVNYDNYYFMILCCANCKHKTEVYVKKGVHLNDIITGVKCSNCECKLEKEK